MGIAEDILAELQSIRAALEGGAGAANGDKPKPGRRSTAPKGPTLEDVQNLIRELVAANDANKPKIKAATESLGGKRAGDFEGDDAKLASLHELLVALRDGGGDDASSDDASSDDDLL